VYLWWGRNRIDGRNKVAKRPKARFRCKR